MHDAIIVGAGPAGTSCALWLKQLGFKPVLIEKNATCGGLQLTNPYTNSWIASSADAYGRDVAAAMHQNMLAHKIEMQLGVSATGAQVLDGAIKVQLQHGESLLGRTLVLAGGVIPRTGGFAARAGMLIGPGTAVEQTNFEGVDVAILGAGDNSLENAHFAIKKGAKSVTIFARSVRARLDLLERVPAENIVLGEYVVDAEAGTVNGRHYGKILVLYGYETDKAALLGLKLAMRSDGFIDTDANCQTSLPGVYAIGEIANRAHPCCVTAMADGVIASKAIQRALESTATAKYAGLARRVLGIGAKVLAK